MWGGGEMVSPSRNPKIGLLLGPAGLTFDGGNIHHVPVADPERTYPEHGPRCTAVAKTSAAGPPSRRDTLIRRGIVAAPSRNPDNKKHGGHTVKESARLRISDSSFVNAFASNYERQILTLIILGVRLVIT